MIDQPNTARLLGETFDLVGPEGILNFAADRAARGMKGLVVNHNTHSLYLLDRNPEMRGAFDAADLVTLDSFPMLFWGKLLGRPFVRAHRSTYTDWRREFWDLANGKRWRVFYLGGEPGVAAAAREKLNAEWPGAVIGVHDGYFDMSEGSADNAAVLAEIEAFEPDIVLVGMGMPRQEVWIARNYAAIRRGVVFSIGAAFDYEAGVQPMPPRWISRAGFQWLYRLLRDPRRMASRYLVEPFALTGRALGDLAETLRLKSPPAPQLRQQF
jgi:N-acetylglucosaminyldiphosphoundecaprenol N-acetyl-beta-D-mannosaminyltransferase